MFIRTETGSATALDADVVSWHDREQFDVEITGGIMSPAAVRGFQVRLPANLRVAVREKCVPGGIRTPNLLIRSQKLYPVELQALALF